MLVASTGYAQTCKDLDHQTWLTACEQLVADHISERNGETLLNIPVGLQLAIEIIKGKYGELNPYMAYQMCQWALTTAEQESYFRFAVGSAGEIGPYQFKLNTVRMVGKIYGFDIGRSDREIVENLLDDTMSTCIFSLFFYHLLMKHHTLPQAWWVYNNGKHARQYVKQVMGRYSRVKQSAVTYCNVQKLATK